MVSLVQVQSFLSFPYEGANYFFAGYTINDKYSFQDLDFNITSECAQTMEGLLYPQYPPEVDGAPDAIVPKVPQFVGDNVHTFTLRAVPHHRLRTD